MGLKDVKLKTKLIGLFLAVGIIPMGFIGVWSIILSENSLMDSSYNQLVSLREVKKAQIESYFSEREGDMEVLLEVVKTLSQNAENKMLTINNLKLNDVEKLLQGWTSTRPLLEDMQLRDVLNPIVQQRDGLGKAVKHTSCSGKTAGFTSAAIC